ncbi:MAG: DUF4388 domain-containing protein [Acidimicrobiia bacterium]|nr:DUF4388 domain-containing protein [Acidimicrobiia bacterium]
MLQGSLDNFSLDEVLNLLAGTMKSGHLRISGDRGTGSLWVDDGLLVQAEASNTVTGGDWEDVMFELLRFESGNFSFVADDLAPSPAEPTEIEPLVERGRELLVEWKSIESVIRSPEHFLIPVAQLPIEQVMLTSAEWETVIRIGEGRTVSQTCSLLSVGELKGCRRIKSVVERGLVTVEKPSARRATADIDAPEALAEAAVDSHPLLEETTDDHGSADVVPLPVSARTPVPEDSEVPEKSNPIVASVPPTPPPAPPSPEEIRQFSSSVEDVSLLGEAPPPPPPPPPEKADADDEASLLMKYLQSET